MDLKSVLLFIPRSGVQNLIQGNLSFGDPQLEGCSSEDWSRTLAGMIISSTRSECLDIFV